MTDTMLTSVWIIPAIMAGSFLVILGVGKRLPEKARAGVGILAVGTCLVLSVITAVGWAQRVDSDQADTVSCGNERFLAPLEAEDHGDSGGHGPGREVDSTIDPEHAAAMPGESAAPAAPTAPAAEDGEHTSTKPVVCAWTWFQIGFPDAAEQGSDDHAAVEAGEHGEAGETVSSENKGNGIFEFGFIVDGLSVMMLLTVTFISLLVHIYSLEYLHGDRRHTHYYAFLSLFTASMLFYVLSSNTLQMLMGWELVGLCSFALIGHWWEDKSNSDAALKAFMTNRVGDMGLMLGIIVTFFAAGAVSFNVLHLNQYALSDGANQTLLLVGALLLFAGVTSKSGQFPLHTWLPDAMAGPTPVSALIHAATMVVAGVYLIARLYGVFFEGLNIGTGSLNYIAVIGGVTVVGGALLAFVQKDIKKVLAYSTISQLGYMVMALGVGAWTAAIFHLFTHAFFKACLFLGAGSVSHAAHHTFDMTKMGGLRKYMPVTFATFMVSTGALIGLFPLAGFWSKDEILAGAGSGQDQAYTLMLVMGLIGAFCTAVYMTRAVYLTFYGEYRGEGTPHESPKVMTVPLVLLAVGATTFGFLNLPNASFLPDGLTQRFTHYVEPTFAFPAISHASFNLPIAVGSTLIGVLGIFLAYQYWALGKSPFKGLSRRQPFAFVYAALENKYWLDVLYTDKIVGSVKGSFARAANWTNQHVVDKVVNGVGVISRVAGDFTYRYLDQGVVDRVIDDSATATDQSGQLLRRIQTGKVQHYAALLFGGTVLFTVVLVLFV